MRRTSTHTFMPIVALRQCCLAVVNVPSEGGDYVPTVMYVTSTPASASYSIGSVIQIFIHFSQMVWVTGTPQLLLATGPVPGTAYYSSGTTVLMFLYTVTAGDDISVLDYWSQWALELNDGRIYSNQDIDADLDMSVPGEEGSLGYNALDRIQRDGNY